jgi:hypothetical protein
MRIGLLLEELIDIAQTAKTDFAISMNMAPSGLSKILKGGRLPFIKEKRTFSRRAATYFAESLYSYHCYLKFLPLFPVIYDFSSKYELEMFLSCALEYAIDKDFEYENDGKPVLLDREASFLGKKNILNLFCVLVSDHITSGNDIPLEFYSTLPLSDHLYFDIFHRIKIANTKKQENIPFNHFINMSCLETPSTDYNLGTLATIARAQKYLDLNLWEINEEIGNPFLLLMGQFLMLFSIQLDGTPLMTFITQKSYLTTFYNSLIRKNTRKISYDGKEARAALANDPSLLFRLTNGPVDAVYNFISIGYLIHEKEMKNIDSDEVVKKAILELFHRILTEETDFYVNIDAMIGFQSSGHAIIPLLGTVDIPLEERISYLKRFDSYIHKDNVNKIRIVNSELPKVAVLCSKGMSIIYLTDNDSEKIHYFRTDMINNNLKKEIAENNMKIMDFSVDLWNNFLDEMSKDLRDVTY